MRGIQRACHGFHFILPVSPAPTRPERRPDFLGRAGLLLFLIVVLILVCAGFAHAQGTRVVTDRDGGTVVLEPYAPNIIRVTLSLNKDSAQSVPGYWFVATPAADGWTHQQGEQGDVYQSSRLVVTVAVNHPGKAMATQVDISKFFNGSAPPANISIRTPEGKTLLQMTGWSMSVPNHKDANAGVLNDRRPSDPPFYQVGATFVSPDDEHYYGLGQYHEGFLDHRGHRVECWHNYLATGGPTVCVPFMVTNYGYGIIWDNPSRTVIEPGFNEETRWTSEVGDRVSFFVIAGKTLNEIYSGYRLLTGATPLLPSVRLHSVQAALCVAGRTVSRGQGISRAPSSGGHPGGGLVLLHENGPDGF